MFRYTAELVANFWRLVIQSEIQWASHQWNIATGDVQSCTLSTTAGMSSRVAKLQAHKPISISCPQVNLKIILDQTT